VNQPAALYLIALVASFFVANGVMAQPSSLAPHVGATVGALRIAEASADIATTAQRNVDALQSAFGTHAGQRRAHAKGVCASGQFVGDVAAQRVSRADAFFSGQPLPASVRLSVGGGDPSAPDAAPGVRGMAVHLSATSATGASQHWLMAAINLPVFSVAHPAFFAGLTMARAQGPAALAAWVQANPQASAQAQIDALAQHEVPASYAAPTYFGVHTFWMVNAHGQRQAVRWQWEPADAQAMRAPPPTNQPHFLAAQLRQRLAHGPVLFHLWLVHAAADDDLLNPTRAWPKERPRTHAGVLRVQAIDDDPRSPCARLSFNPLVLPDGIEPSADPVLQSRAAAYGVSLMRRTSEHLGLTSR
jgi:catalase